MKNKETILIVISLLCCLYLGLFIYYIDTKEIKPKKKPNNYIQDNMMTIDKVLKFIKDNKIYYLDNINKTFTSEEITNQNKLRYAYLVLKDEVNFNNGVSITRFNSLIQSTFGESTIIKNENIVNNDKEILIDYDDINEVYKYRNDNVIYEYMYSYYDHVVDFKINDNTYILTVNKFFVKDNKVYGNIDDLKIDKNILFMTQNEDINSYIKQYVIENYDTLKDKLSTYKYNFSKEKGNLFLKKYEKVQKDKENM